MVGPRFDCSPRCGVRCIAPRYSLFVGAHRLKTYCGRRELPRLPQVKYFAFTDPSGGSQDSFTLAIAHLEGNKAILDALRERRPPFSPEAVTAEYAALLKTYGIAAVFGDRYGGEWVQRAFAKTGIRYQASSRTKSDIYRELLPLVNSGRVELLDNPRLIHQLLNLERRTSRGGKESIDHMPGTHDDLINAAAGALVMAVEVVEDYQPHHPAPSALPRTVPLLKRWFMAWRRVWLSSSSWVPGRAIFWVVISAVMSCWVIKWKMVK